MRETLKKENNGWVGFEEFDVIDKVSETDSIASFYLKRKNNKGIPIFKAGHYLSIRIEPDNEIIVRNYSISCGEKAENLRISVKKEESPQGFPGIVSNHLHNKIEIGDTLKVRIRL